MRDPKQKVLHPRHKEYLLYFFLEHKTNKETAEHFEIDPATFSVIKNSIDGQKFLHDLAELPKKGLEELVFKALVKLEDMLDHPEGKVKMDAVKTVLKYNFSTKTESKLDLNGELKVVIEKQYDGI